MSAFPQVSEDGAVPPKQWKKYVRTLCTDAWDFDATETGDVVDRLEQLHRDKGVTDGAVVDVLLAAGVSETSAMLIAPSIRVSILS